MTALSPTLLAAIEAYRDASYLSDWPEYSRAEAATAEIAYRAARAALVDAITEALEEARGADRVRMAAIIDEFRDALASMQKAASKANGALFSLQVGPIEPITMAEAMRPPHD
jgi:5'-deoxynucleotidase YfbR-like HD superfamily hydrolase